MSKELEDLNKIRRLLIKEYQYLVDAVEQALNELEELKRDVSRYFELQYKNQFSSMSQNEIYEMYVLRDKLSKVGKE